MVGVIGFFDGNPKRYAKEKRADFLEHFCDILGYAVVDVTDRKKAEALREDVERMTRHDLKSPLTAILTLPQLFKREGNLTPRQIDMLNLVQSAGYRMLHMINQSLDLYRMERGVYELNPQPVDLLPILDNIAAELRGVAESKDLAMDIVVRGRPRGRATPSWFGARRCCATPCSRIWCATRLRPRLRAAGSSWSCPRTPPWRWPCATPAACRGRSAPVLPEIRDRRQKGRHGTRHLRARLIAQTHGGRIRMETSEEKGTTVTVFFPK
jgi:light-regulated signal transduction histidine kinase (bacteriophytochrome)